MEKALFSSNTSNWETPTDLFYKLDQIYQFNTDVCALPENAKCKDFYTPEINGLNQVWEGTVWMNPPYGKEMYKWIEKAYNEMFRGVTIVALLPVRTDTKWFHDFINEKVGVSVKFIKGRLKFSNSKNSAPFPSMIVEFKYWQ